MWCKTYNKSKIATVAFLAMIFSCSLQIADAAQMSDYCITPPYISTGIPPNLLLMIDNSSSMFDLQYVDKGKFTGTCSVTTTQTCSNTANCPTGETCNNITFARNPYYCYDQTYKSSNTYAGYFNTNKLYQYDAANRDFYEIATFPTSCSNTLKQITSPSNTLFVCYTTSPKDVTTFAAKGNYLNWLTASKFDEQKQILTGGKYVIKVCSNALDTSCVADSECPSGGTCTVDPPDFLQAESRGCVGRGFVKEALTTDFVDYSSPETNNPNASLGLTFSVKGPIDTANPTAPSPGGQTSIEIYDGNYDQSVCQTAIDVLSNPASGNADINKAVDDCLSTTTAAGAHCQFDNSLSCTKSSDCIFGNGSCSIVNDGACNVVTGGVCGVKTAGVCTAYNSPTCDCIGSHCTAICSNAGPLNGTACKNANACKTSGCTAGKPSLINTVCTTSANCDDKWCTAGRMWDSCGSNANCDPSACVGGPRDGLTCTNDAACNSSHCVAPSQASKIGSLCSTNTDCNADLSPCISGTATTVSKTKVVFNESMQACWAYHKGTPIGTDEVNTVHNQCADLYDENYVCIGGDNNALACTSNADCPGGGSCKNGPEAIQPGNPSYLCSKNYAGFCAQSASGTWTDTTWIANGYTSADECVIQKHTEFCNAMDASPVIDPTDAPSETSNYGNLPAIISDIGVEAQLGQPLKSLKVRVRQATPPTHLIQEFKDRIRMGAMKFNFNGTVSPECSNATGLLPGTLPCPKVCSTDTTKTCGSSADCPFPSTAPTCALATNNLDGAQIVHYIGVGHCYLTPGTACILNADCTALGDTCKAEVGDHTSGLIREIDNIKASTWTPFAEAFYDAVGYFGQMSNGESNTNLRINTTDFDVNKNPSQIPCQMNNFLLITDGMSTADLNTDVGTFAGLYTSGTPTLYGAGTGNSCGASSLPYSGSINLDNIAWAAKNRKISELTKNTVVTDVPTTSHESISTYVVLAGASNGLSGDCDSRTLLSNTAKNGGTQLYTAETPTLLDQAITDAFFKISSTAAAGTAASVLASGEGSGANLIQAVFYPQKKFPNTATGTDDKINWIGRLTNLWYYVDPFLGNSSIMEDNGCALCTVGTATIPAILNPAPWNGNKTLDLMSNSTTTTGDYVISMYFDPTAGVTKANRWSDNGTGVIGTPLKDIGFEDLGYLWEAGTLLWQRDVTTAAGKRKIYTTISSGPTYTLLSGNFSSNTINPTPAAGTPDADNSAALALNLSVTAADATNLINWVQGVDYPDTGVASTSAYRSRTVKIESIDTTPRVWKLGDVVNSTPKLMSWTGLNNYGVRYNDTTYGKVGALEEAVDVSSFVTTTAYKQRGVVFAGGNDGMLHAFKLGTLQLNWKGQTPDQTSTQKARMLANYDVTTHSGALCTAGTCGQELWAFIPKNVLPYLKYTADTGYCHINSVDLTPFIFDASIGAPGSGDISANTRTVDDWRTIVIGGMRFGGACKSYNDTCVPPACVKNPDSNDAGYSSYFALDVTDPNNPSLLWEFTDPNLGFATTGPAVIRINKTDRTTNGNWFVVIGSGPTGPISTGDHQFLGQSDQPLSIFVLDLKTGVTKKVFTPTGLGNAFVGSLLGGAIDVDEDYQDEVLYIPYVKKDTSVTPNTWTKGGVLRLMTKKNTDPLNWQVSTLIDNDDIGPVTSSVVKIKDSTNDKLWAFFGEGRYYYLKGDSSDDPSPSVNRRLFGLKDTCLPKMKMANTACSDTVAFSDLVDVTNNPSAPEDPEGWFLSLDPTDATAGLNAERDITDPLATSSGVVYFTTYKPYTNLCTLGGKTFIWAMKYNTGGCVNNIKGKVLVQVSTGAIQQLDLSQIFGCNLPSGPTPPGPPPPPDPDPKGGRRTGAMEGKPPEMQGLSVVSAPSSVNRTIHVRER